MRNNDHLEDILSSSPKRQNRKPGVAATRRISMSNVNFSFPRSSNREDSNEASIWNLSDAPKLSKKVDVMNRRSVHMLSSNSNSSSALFLSGSTGVSSSSLVNSQHSHTSQGGSVVTVNVQSPPLVPVLKNSIHGQQSQQQQQQQQQQNQQQQASTARMQQKRASISSFMGFAGGAPGPPPAAAASSSTSSPPPLRGLPFGKALSTRNLLDIKTSFLTPTKEDEKQEQEEEDELYGKTQSRSGSIDSYILESVLKNMSKSEIEELEDDYKDDGGIVPPSFNPDDLNSSLHSLSKQQQKQQQQQQQQKPSSWSNLLNTSNSSSGSRRNHKNNKSPRSGNSVTFDKNVLVSTPSESNINPNGTTSAIAAAANSNTLLKSSSLSKIDSTSSASFLQQQQQQNQKNEKIKLGKTFRRGSNLILEGLKSIERAFIDDEMSISSSSSSKDSAVPRSPEEEEEEEEEVDDDHDTYDDEVDEIENGLKKPRKKKTKKKTKTTNMNRYNEDDDYEKRLQEYISSPSNATNDTTTTTTTATTYSSSSPGGGSGSSSNFQRTVTHGNYKKQSSQTSLSSSSQRTIRWRDMDPNNDPAIDSSNNNNNNNKSKKKKQQQQQQFDYYDDEQDDYSYLDSSDTSELDTSHHDHDHHNDDDDEEEDVDDHSDSSSDNEQKEMMKRKMKFARRSSRVPMMGLSRLDSNRSLNAFGDGELDSVVGGGGEQQNDQMWNDENGSGGMDNLSNSMNSSNVEVVFGGRTWNIPPPKKSHSILDKISPWRLFLQSRHEQHQRQSIHHHSCNGSVCGSMDNTNVVMEKKTKKKNKNKGGRSGFHGITFQLVTKAPCFWFCCARPLGSTATDRTILARLNILCAVFAIVQAGIGLFLTIVQSSNPMGGGGGGGGSSNNNNGAGMMHGDEGMGMEEGELFEEGLGGGGGSGGRGGRGVGGGNGGGLALNLWNMNNNVYGMSLVCLFLFGTMLFTIRVVREVNLKGTVRYMWILYWLVPSTIFLSLSLFDYYRVTNVWIKHWWASDSMSWYRSAFCKRGTSNGRCLVPIGGGEYYDSEEEWCMGLHNGATDCQDIRNGAQTKMQAWSYIFYTSNAVLGLVIIVLLLLALSILKAIITPPIVQASKEANIPSWLILPTVGCMVSGFFFRFSPYSVINHRAGTRSDWIGVGYISAGFAFALAALMGWGISIFPVLSSRKKRQKIISVSVFITLMILTIILVVAIFISSLIYSSQIVTDDVSGSQRGFISCSLGQDCTNCKDHEGYDPTLDQCPEWTRDDVLKVLQTQLKQSATASAIFCVYAVEAVRFGFLLRNHCASFEIEYV